MNSQARKVVITGIGPISSCGIGRENLWQSLLNKDIKLTKENFEIDGEVLDSFYLHKISNFNINNFGIDEKSINLVKSWKEGEDDIDLYYLIAAIQLALQDSCLLDGIEKDEVGLILGHGNPGLEQYWEKTFNETYEILKKEKNISKADYFKRFFDTFVKTAYDLQTYMYLFHVGRMFNLHGFQLFLNNACSSGLYALEIASQMIKNDRGKVAIVATAGRSRYYKYLWFKKANYPYAVDGKIKPFDKSANGIVLGDGAVAFIVEELEHAISRKANIYGEYLGGDFCSESWKVVLPAINESYYEGVIEKALTNCNCKKEDIDILNPHGTGLTIVDKYEARAINSVFGDKKPLISVFKPYIGHCIGASALLETAILLLSLKNNIVLPTLNYSGVDQKLNLQVVTEMKKQKLKKVMKTCCAIAGFDAAAIFQKIE